MKTIPLSSKYQIVIPKAARKKMGITSSADSLYIKKVTSEEIIIAKSTSTAQYLTDLLKLDKPTKTDAVNRVRKLREEWDERTR